MGKKAHKAINPIPIFQLKKSKIIPNINAIPPIKARNLSR